MGELLVGLPDVAVLEALAVNPNATTVSGDPAVADLPSVPGELDGVIVMVNTEAAVGALMSGVRAAFEFGASLIAADDRDLYLSRSAFDQLDSLVAAIPDSLSRTRLRVVDDDAPGIISW